MVRPDARARGNTGLSGFHFRLTYPQRHPTCLVLVTALSFSHAWLLVAHSAAPIAMACSSLSAFCLLQGSPAVWYSSVSLGSNILRKLTLLLWPPVARITPLLARTFTVRPSTVAVTPRAFPDEGRSLTMRVILCRNRNSTPLALALFSSG